MKSISDEFSPQLNALLREAIAFDNAYKGLIQLYDEKRQQLHVIAQVGFGERFLSLFKVVKAFDPSACGRALGMRTTILINDVNFEKAFLPFKEVIAEEGFRSVKAVPLFKGSTRIVGILSTHFQKPQHLILKKGEIPDELLKKISDLIHDLSSELKEKI